MIKTANKNDYRKSRKRGQHRRNVSDLHKSVVSIAGMAPPQMKWSTSPEWQQLLNRGDQHCRNGNTTMQVVSIAGMSQLYRKGSIRWKDS